MRLEQLIATPHPDGHQIDLTWANPDATAYPGIRVVRREGTHPTHPDDGVVVADGTDVAFELDEQERAWYRIADTALKGETVYYYSLYPYSGDPPDFQIDRANRTAALAGTAHGLSEHMYALLPAIYHRYDAEQEPLHRFLELPGGQFDLLYSFARALLNLYNLDQVDGRLLPLLAQWIGWKTDFRLEIDQQRHEIRNATALYRRIGMIPVVGATVQRISGWENRTKEFVHNVFRTNRPARLNLWARHVAIDGTVLAPDALLSLDFAYEGRPAAVPDEQGIRWLFYHTLRRGRWGIWYKTSPTFSLGLSVAEALVDGTTVTAAVQQAFAAAGIALAADATVAAAGSRWRIEDTTNGETYILEPGGERLTAYQISAEPLVMAPSQPFATGRTRHEKCPAVALQGDVLWVFWSTYDVDAGRWMIYYRTRRDGRWMDEDVAFTHGAAEPVPERKAPAVLVDQDDGLWLFWLERTRSRWQLKYNRYDPAGLASDPPDPAAWQLDPPAVFPADGADDPRVEADVFVRFHPGDAGRRIWVFWARKEATTDPAQTRWAVAYRIKAGIDPAASDWGAIETLPKNDETDHDREPAALVNADGTLTVYWSSDRGGSRSIWRAILDPDAAPPWSGAEERTSSPYAQHAPFPLAVEDGRILIYRSNESLSYTSDVYRAAETVDGRYAGSMTVDTRNTDKIALGGAFEDFQTYTHDTGTEDVDRYRRDTIGIYLTPDTLDPDDIEQGIARLRQVLPEFMPATDRAVFIPREDLHTEYVYTYDLAAATEPSYIAESYTDLLTSTLENAGLGPDEDFTDTLE